MYFNLMAKISATEKVSGIEQAAVTFTGIAVVFLVLLILIIFVGCFGKFFDKSKKNNSTSNGGASGATAAKANTETKSNTVSFACDDDEVIAVISAVIAQMSAADGKNYKIKSVKRKNTKAYGRPIWATEGLRQNTNPF